MDPSGSVRKNLQSLCHLHIQLFLGCISAVTFLWWWEFYALFTVCRIPVLRHLLWLYAIKGKKKKGEVTCQSTTSQKEHVLLEMGCGCLKSASRQRGKSCLRDWENKEPLWHHQGEWSSELSSQPGASSLSGEDSQDHSSVTKTRMLCWCGEEANTPACLVPLGGQTPNSAGLCDQPWGRLELTIAESDGRWPKG